MEHDDASYLDEINPPVRSDHLRLGIAVLIGAALGLGVYFLVLNNNPTQNANQAAATNQATALCVCPNCGTTVHRPKGIDCEELNCPNCGKPLVTGITLAAAGGNARGAGVGAAPGTGAAGGMTQNRRETLAERGVIAPGPITQNQRQTLAEQGIATVPKPVAMTTLPPMGTKGKCICPNCGKTVDRPQGVACANMRCPNCQSQMTNAITIGHARDPRDPRDMILAAAGPAPAAPCPGAVAAGPPPCPHVGGGAARPCPGAGGGAAATPQGQSKGTAAVSQGITYTNTIKGIVTKDCLGCHGGPIRNLETYDHVKVYADNGLLLMMTQPGGPMSRFLTAHEFKQISMWVKAGAPN